MSGSCHNKINRDKLNCLCGLDQDLGIHDISIYQVRGGGGSIKNNSEITNTESRLDATKQPLGLRTESRPSDIDIRIEQEGVSDFCDFALNKD